MRDFYDLTIRGRALRLRRLALAALVQYDLPVERVRLITNETNGIFRIDTEDGRKLVMRVCLGGDIAHSLDQIRSEMMWLNALQRDTALHIPAPLANRAGEFVTTAQVDGVPEPRHCAIFSWVPGRDIADQLTVENVARWGTFAAELHAHGAAFQPPDGFSIVTYNRIFPFDEPVVLFEDDHREFLPPERRALFDEALVRVEEGLARLKASGEPMRVLHGDLHQWNVKLSRGKIGAFDFEDLMWGWPVQDIATTLYYVHGEDQYEAWREAFRGGYEKRLAWPERAPGEIETFMAGRVLVLANDILITPEWLSYAPSYFKRAEGRLRNLLRGEPFSLSDYR